MVESELDVLLKVSEVVGRLDKGSVCCCEVSEIEAPLPFSQHVHPHLLLCLGVVFQSVDAKATKVNFRHRFDHCYIREFVYVRITGYE